MAASTPCLPAGVLDEPVSGESLPLGYALVRGWALSDPSVSSVRIRINQQAVAWARLGMPRPDLAADMDRAEAAVCGFEAHLDLSRCAVPGPALVDAEVTTLDGSTYVVGPVRVDFTTPDRLVRRPVDSAAPEIGLRTGVAGARVAVFTHDLSLGGAQLRMLDYLRHMTPTRPQFAVVSQKDGPLREDLAVLDIPVHIIGSDGRESEASYEESLDKAIAWIDGGAYDVIWANTLVSFFGVDVALRLGLPSLYLIHEGLDPCLFWGPELASGHTAPHAYRRCLVALASASSVVCVADAARRTFEPYRRLPITVVSNSIDVSAVSAYRATHDRREARQRLGLGKMDRLVLSCAPVVPHKGQAVLAQAVAQIAAAHPRTACVMIGHIGHPYGNGIAAYVSRAGLGARIRLESPVEDVYQWFLAADLFVLPSDDEALASVVLEAMAFGLPVVTSDVAGMPEVIEDGENGFLCRSRNVADLTAVLDKALSTHPAVWQAMTAAAMKRVQENHDIAARAGVLEGLIADLVAPSPTVAGVPILDTLHREGRSDEVGIDVALALSVDLVLEGVANGSILQLGSGVGVSFALAEMGYSVTSLGIDIDGGAFTAWRWLAARVGLEGRAIPRLSFERLNDHLAGLSHPYEAALLLGLRSAEGGWPGVDVCETLAQLHGRTARAYLEFPCQESGDLDSDGVVAGLAARGMRVEAHWVSSTVGPEGDPLRLYRFDLHE